MKLSRQTTSGIDRHDKERSITGCVRASELLRGNKHHFIIENATAAELEAMDDLLCETEFKHYCDTCPLYDEGYSCGWWVDVDDVDDFKATYKRLKGHVAARVSQNRAAAQGEALATMTTEEVKTVARIAYQVARELRTKSESLSSLRTIGTDAAIILNPYHTNATPITAKGWELLAECLSVGTVDDVCKWLAAIQKTIEALVETREAAHEEALKINHSVDVELSILRRDVRGYCREFSGAKLDEVINQDIRRVHKRLVEVYRVVLSHNFFKGLVQESKPLNEYHIAAAHTEALEFNETMDRSLVELCAGDSRGLFDVLDAHSKMLLINACHTEALKMNTDKAKEMIPNIPFNPTIANDGLTEEQGKAYNAQNIFFYQSTGAQRAAAIDVAHAEALEINRETPRFNEAADVLANRITRMKNEALALGETIQVEFWTKLNSAQREQAVQDAHSEALEHDALCDALNASAAVVSGQIFKSDGAELLVSLACVYRVWDESRCKRIKEVTPSQIIADPDTFRDMGVRRTMDVIPGVVEDADFPLNMPGEWLTDIFKREVKEPELPPEIRNLEAVLHDLYRTLTIPDLSIEHGVLIGHWMENGERKTVTLYEGENIQEMHDRAAKMNQDEINYWNDQHIMEQRAEQAVERYFEEGNGHDAFRLEEEDRRLGFI